MTIRGGGNPHSAMAAMPLREWTRRLGALPAEAYDCFMVGTRYGFNRIQAWFDASGRGQWQAPLGSSRGQAGRRARVRQEQAFRGAGEAPLRATAMQICDRDGRMLAARVEQKNGTTKNDKMARCSLDKESPIQAEWRIDPLSGRVHGDPWTGNHWHGDARPIADNICRAQFCRRRRPDPTVRTT